MRSLVRKFPEIVNEINQGVKQVEDYFKTNELFEIFFELSTPNPHQSTAISTDDNKNDFSDPYGSLIDEPMSGSRSNRKNRNPTSVQFTQQSFYGAMDQFDDESQISVEDFDIDF